MGIKISVKLVDDFERYTTKRFELKTADPAQAVTDALVVAPLVAAASDCGLVSCTVLIPAAITPTAPTANANLDAGATIQGRLAGASGKFASLKLPAPLASYLNPDGTVDLTDATLKALLDKWIPATDILLISDGEGVTEWLRGTLDR